MSSNTDRAPATRPTLAPLALMAPGLVLLLTGALVLADPFGSRSLAAVLLVIGQASFLLGAIAQGVAWGQALIRK